MTSTAVNRFRILKLRVEEWRIWECLDNSFMPYLCIFASSAAFGMNRMDAAKIFVLWGIFWKLHNLEEGHRK